MKIIKMGHLARINTQNMEDRISGVDGMCIPFLFFSLCYYQHRTSLFIPSILFPFFSWLTKEKKKNTAIILLLFPHILESNI